MRDVYEQLRGRHPELTAWAIENRAAKWLGSCFERYRMPSGSSGYRQRSHGPPSGDLVGSGGESIVSPNSGQPTAAKVDELECVVIGQDTRGASLDLGPSYEWDARIAEPRFDVRGAECLSHVENPIVAARGLEPGSSCEQSHPDS